eukprot:CAMPEP_0181331452 /NCGR_PEP_ID=MMETSP1101-20121128/24507_1 /TAXON_ID=46948 /ORGANISM="Rhodomonas abbreviata, Strain Caron Lab Isolate" /LENGTH=536 /DNA_ID=CAMNT_0023440909 /DNA_START=24 /DNA_END=1634 /DNA_ORIENTATION=-
MLSSRRIQFWVSASLVVLLLACGNVKADEGEEDVDESEVLVLTSANFEESITFHKYLMVEFYAPWCGHCQHLKPEYARAAKALKEAGVNVKLAKLDATEHEDIAQQHDVQGYPTMKWYKDGTLTDKEIMLRQESEIVRWVQKNTGPPAKTLASSAEITEQTAALGFITVGFFEDLDSEELAIFNELAAHDDRNDYFIVTEKSVIKDEGITLVPQVIFYRNFDEPKVVFPGKIDAYTLKLAVTANSRPKVIDFLEDTAQMIFDNELPKALLFKGEGEVKEEFVQLAHDEEYAGKYIFATVGEKGDPEFGKFLGVSESPEAEFFMFDVRDGSKYKLTGTLTKETMGGFIKSFDAGEATPFLKSSPVLEGWDSEPVKQIVSSQWEEFTTQDAHIVMEFYAPWCGHCQQLEPKYNKVAEYFESKYAGEVVVAKMDYTLNEIAGIQIQGFPTVLLLPKGKKEEKPLEFPQEELTDTNKIVKTIKAMLELSDKKRPGEEEYQAAAKRFKNAVKGLKKSLEPAAEALNKASEAIEALAAKDEL